MKRGKRGGKTIWPIVLFISIQIKFLVWEYLLWLFSSLFTWMEGGEAKLKSSLLDFIYPHLPGPALSSTPAPIPVMLVSLPRGQWQIPGCPAEVGGPVLMSH